MKPEALMKSLFKPLPGFEEASAAFGEFTVTGFVCALNRMGQAGFLKLKDEYRLDWQPPSALQVYVRKDVVGDEAYRKVMHGQMMGVEVEATGVLFVTRLGWPALLARNIHRLNSDR